MITTGTLIVSSGISQLNGIRLALQGPGNQFTAATNFLANQGFGNNSPISVDGTNGFVGTVPAIFINSVSSPAARAARRAAAKGGASRKGAKKPAAKKPAKKRAAKKSSRKGPAKKSASKKSRKSSRKR